MCLERWSHDSHDNEHVKALFISLVNEETSKTLQLVQERPL